MTPQGKPIFSDLSGYPTLTPLEQELLAALKDIIRLELGEDYFGSTPEQRDAMKGARAAIAKAEGR